jgi:hypothetical protein
MKVVIVGGAGRVGLPFGLVLAYWLTAIGKLVGIVFSDYRLGDSVVAQQKHRVLRCLTRAPFNWPFLVLSLP